MEILRWSTENSAFITTTALAVAILVFLLMSPSKRQKRAMVPALSEEEQQYVRERRALALATRLQETSQSDTSIAGDTVHEVPVPVTNGAQKKEAPVSAPAVILTPKQTIKIHDSGATEESTVSKPPKKNSIDTVKSDPNLPCVDQVPPPIKEATKEVPMKTTTLKTAPQVKKRSRKVPVPQLLSEILTSITKLNVVVKQGDNEFKPHSMNTATMKRALVLLGSDQSMSSVTLPPNPKTLRDVAGWYNRARATSRNGFPPHLTKRDDEGYDDFVCLTKNIMNRLVEQTQRLLLAEIDDDLGDDNEEEEDLFSGLAAPTAHQQNSYTQEFFSLLEGTPSPIGKPFLDQIFSSNNGAESSIPRLTTTILKKSLYRFNDLPTTTLVSMRSNALSMLLLSQPIAQAWSKRMEEEFSSSGPMNGHEMEKASWAAPLLRICAFSVPEAGTETRTNKNRGLFAKEFESLENFPDCIYENKKKNLAIQYFSQTEKHMESARRVAELLLKKGGKHCMFKWLNQVIQANDAMAGLLQADLLAANGVASVCASRRFLLGLCSTVVTLCTESLAELFGKEGANAFDLQYFSSGRMEIDENERMLVRGKNMAAAKDDSKFSGGTEFFFLTCSLLRVSLSAALRMNDQFLQRYAKVLNAVQSSAKAKTPTNPAYHSVVSAHFGFRTFLEDSTLAPLLTKFTILQLEWLLSVRNSLENVPEWMMKIPSAWLELVARYMQQHLNPYLQNKTIEAATQLLQLGTKENDDRAFSPVVVDRLVRIVSAFVEAGVHRARQREKRRGNLDDNFDPSIYVTFDRNDLGVTVFTNDSVKKELCPTIMQTFAAVDVVEGLDVDREHGFDKFSAKGRIAKLFMLLWCHPDGECKKSVLRLDENRVSSFAKHVAIALGVLYDFSNTRLSDVCDGSKRRLTQKDQRFLQSQGASVGNELSFSRLWTNVLCKISEEPRVCRILGSTQLASSLASLIIHFIDIWTDPDGGMNSNFDFAQERSADLMKKSSSLNAAQKQKLAASVTEARYRVRTMYGLDVSIVCHQFLALLSCWHKQAKDSTNKSPILVAFASHCDFEPQRYRNILTRLLAEKPAMYGSESECADAIFLHDGHVDTSAWEHQYKELLPKNPEAESQMRRARQDQMTHEALNKLASHSDISKFLDEVASFRETSNSFTPVLVPSEVLERFNSVLASGKLATNDTYSDSLKDWLVNSVEFANTHDSKTFNHYYDSTARTRGVACSGKKMYRESRRCYKNLPVPHPNSAAFCCFAEERMDLARAAITGPIDSPYAHGIFVFEVFFPANYPSIPPLVTFMTTGGGQTRFNPNLYSDGKVCLSLLGTFHASDESQKWNPEFSSLAQILLSIQTQLLVEEPYFNEPGNESRKGTQVGIESSTRYNLVLQLATLRHAILAPLKVPPTGLEDICTRHFGLCRKRIMVQARRWMLEAKSSSLYPRFSRTYAELVQVFAEKFGNDDFALPPCTSDVLALRKLNVSFKFEGDDEVKEDSKVGLATRSVSGTIRGRPGQRISVAPRTAAVANNISVAQSGGSTGQQNLSPADIARFLESMQQSRNSSGNSNQRTVARPQQRQQQRGEVTELSLAAAVMATAAAVGNNPWDPKNFFEDETNQCDDDDADASHHEEDDDEMYD